jgi:hypothetical protein
MKEPPRSVFSAEPGASVGVAAASVASAAVIVFVLVFVLFVIVIAPSSSSSSWIHSKHTREAPMAASRQSFIVHPTWQNIRRSLPTKRTPFDDVFGEIKTGVFV